MSNQLQIQINNLIIKTRKEKRGEVILKTKKPHLHSLEALKGDKGNKDVLDIGIDQEGLYMIIDGENRKVRGFPDGETMMLVTIYKHLFYLIAEDFKRKGWIKRIIIALALYFNKDIWQMWFNRMWSCGYYLLKDEYWQRPVRELRRVLLKHFPQELADAVVMVIEYDNAYKLPLQDILPEFNKANLTGYFSARREIMRVCDIFYQRGDIGYQQKITALRSMLSIALLIPKINKLARDILLELDMDKVRMNDDDKYWASHRVDYKYKLK
jgi:hypothetical protein